MILKSISEMGPRKLEAKYGFTEKQIKYWFDSISDWTEKNPKKCKDFSRTCLNWHRRELAKGLIWAENKGCYVQEGQKQRPKAKYFAAAQTDRRYFKRETDFDRIQRAFGEEKVLELYQWFMKKHGIKSWSIFVSSMQKNESYRKLYKKFKERLIAQIGKEPKKTLTELEGTLKEQQKLFEY